MSGGLGAYEAKLTAAKAKLRAMLRDATGNATEVAVYRSAIKIMEGELTNNPNAVRRFPADRKKGLNPEDVWERETIKVAYKPFDRKTLDAATFTAKQAEFSQLVTQIRARQSLDKTFEDKFNGVVYVTHENKEVRTVLTDIIWYYGEWFARHVSDPDFGSVLPADLLLNMMRERQDLVEALRYAQSLPKDFSTWPVPVDRPAMVEVLEIGISFIPYVGTAVALMEAATGRDIFGYKLDEADRVILAAGALLPFAARFVKGGRALYTASRLAKLYGRDASRYERVIAIGERYSGNPQLARKIRDARKLTMAGKKAEAQTVQEIADGLKKLDLKNAQPRIIALPQPVTDAIKKLGSGKPIIAELDELAIERVAAKKIKVHMRGQLLEEFLEARILKWLRDPAGAAALGIDNKEVLFLPGHMLRHPTGMRQITDGVLVRRSGNVLEIAAIFESKSSVRSVREIRLAKTGKSVLTADDLEELGKVAREEFEAAKRLAESQGKTYTKTVADHEAELLKPLTQQEEGQARRSIERLFESDEHGMLSSVYVGDVLTPIRISPTKTKIFGVVPKGTDLPLLEQQCKALGFNFEALGMDITKNELNSFVDSIASAMGVPR